MTRAQEIRHECLRQLYGARPLWRTAANIRKIARREDAVDWSESEVAAELVLLTQQQFAEELRDPGLGVLRYRISGKGTFEWEANYAS